MPPLWPAPLLLRSARALPLAFTLSTAATCILSLHDHTLRPQTGPCIFSQRLRHGGGGDPAGDAPGWPQRP
jgi:hypothetical protein